MKQTASIFNDVLGPVMTGPSSSHTAGPCRIGLMGWQLLQKKMPKTITIRFERRGAFAVTYNRQGSDRGLVGGLMGVGPDEEKLHTALGDAEKLGISYEFIIDDFEANHPNTTLVTAITEDGERVDLTGISTGGGMFKVVGINGFSVSMVGDYYELILTCSVDMENEIKPVLEKWDIQGWHTEVREGQLMINAKFNKPLDSDLLRSIETMEGVSWLRYLEPILPILSGKDNDVPFVTNEEMQRWIEANGGDFWEAAAEYEAKRGHTTKEAVIEKMGYIADVMRASVMDGLNNPMDGQIIKPRAGVYSRKSKDGKLIPLGVIDTAIAWTMAVVEVNSRYGRLVAAPTAGSCGVIPGAIWGAAESLGLSKDEVVKALFAAGMTGVFIAEKATFAAEVGGCQVECGAGSAMAAAGVVQLYGGTPAQCAAAASMALQNVLGMVCDSVAELVESPCLGRNVLSAVNAITCANMAMAGVEEIIPLDETIESMMNVANLMPSELCCTGRCGLAITKTSAKIKERLGF